MKDVRDGFEEFERTYSHLGNITGMTVVDLGAETGNSPNWFLIHGAKMVIAFESNSRNYLDLKENCIGDDRVEVHGTWMGEFVEGDVLKVDIEGGESMLRKELLQRYKKLAVALHPGIPGAITQEKYQELKDELIRLGATCVCIIGDHAEEMYVKT